MLKQNDLGLELEKLFIGIDLPGKVEMGVSGCAMACGESFVRDIGEQGHKEGWTFIFGGNSGGYPRIGDVLAEELTSERWSSLRKNIQNTTRLMVRRERTARFVERIGIDAMKEAIGLPG